MRLNRYLARAGGASRRKCDLLIQQGAITVNGQVVEDAGRCVVVDQDRVQVDGRNVTPPRSFEYLLLNKPADCLVTHADTHGRPTVFDQVRGLRPGTVAVGRLDQDTTGLLLLTDDGDLAHRLMHPRYGVDKVYVATVRRTPTASQLERLRRGVQLEDGVTAPARVRLLRRRRAPGHDGGRSREAQVEIGIREGRKRQVRRMVEAVGHSTLTLRRVEFAGLALAGLETGEHRRLRPDEVKRLRALVGL